MQFEKRAKDAKRHFTEENKQMAKQHKKWCSAYQPSEKTKTTAVYYYGPTVTGN